jgi:hypothetical protein
MDLSSGYELLVKNDLLAFYGWWQLAVCLFAFAALMAIWWHIGRKRNDFGQVWLALSVLCWSFSGGVEVFYANQMQEQGQEAFILLDQIIKGDEPATNPGDLINSFRAEYDQLTEYHAGKSFELDGWRSILSLFNSLFILLALPWFRYIPKQIEAVVSSKYWVYIVGLPFLFSLFPTISKMFSGRSLGLISELDVYYAILTLIFLGLVLWESFARRRLRMLAWLSLVCILITFVAQLFKLTASDIDLNLFSAIFKTSLIMIFFALALSWVKELAEDIIPASGQLFLEMKEQRGEAGKLQYTVSLRGLPGETRTVHLTPALYELLKKFAGKKLEDGEGWMEIKPKHDGRQGKVYDIRDHNEIKRLVVALLDGIFGKDMWTRTQHEEPLRNAMFERSPKRERKIRLRIPAENISVEENS